MLVVKYVVCTDEIPGELIVNCDQTDVNYIPVSSSTMQIEELKS